MLKPFSKPQPIHCVLCDFKTHAGDNHPTRSIRQHWTLKHKAPLPCTEMTCAGMTTEHNYGEPACSYHLDPVKGLISKEELNQ